MQWHRVYSHRAWKRGAPLPVGSPSCAGQLAPALFLRGSLRRPLLAPLSFLLVRFRLRHIDDPAGKLRELHERVRLWFLRRGGFAHAVRLLHAGCPRNHSPIAVNCASTACSATPPNRLILLLASLRDSAMSSMERAIVLRASSICRFARLIRSGCLGARCFVGWLTSQKLSPLERIG